MKRGEIWWASLRAPAGSGPGYRRPVLIVQSDPFNLSRIRTIIAVVITSNIRLAEAPGNVRLPKRESGLRRESVVNVSQIITVDRSFLTECAGRISLSKQREVDDGMRLVLAL